MSLSPFTVDENTFLKQNINLPPLSRTLLQVLEVIHSRISGAAEVAELVSRDAAMATHILKVVNSAYYCLPTRIANIQHAIAYLGLAQVSHICLTLSVINTLKPGDRAELQYFWLHSYYTALIARNLSKEFKNIPDAGELYSAALLHDIGQLVYQRFYPDHFHEMRHFCSQKGTFLTDAEEQFGFASHLTFGSLLADHWALPQSIKRACSFHELRDLRSIQDTSNGESFDIIITVSNMLAALARANLHENLKEEITAEVRRVLNMSKDQFLAFLGSLYDLERKAEASITRLV